MRGAPAAACKSQRASQFSADIKMVIRFRNDAHDGILIDYKLHVEDGKILVYDGETCRK